MKPITTILTFLTFISVHADPVQRLKDMISMAGPVEGRVVQSAGGTNRFASFGVQPGTWFFIDYRPGSEADMLMAGGESRQLTWAYSGNMVQAMPRSETVPLEMAPGGEGRIGPESAVEMALSAFSYRTRFGIHIASTNIVWDGLSFKAPTRHPSFLDGSRLTGRIEVSNGIPVSILTTLSTTNRVSSRVTELSGHDDTGFPRRWRLVIDGNPGVHSFEFTELSFEPRRFADDLGYTPSMFGESGREWAIFYTNRTMHVVEPDGNLRAIVPASPIQASGSFPWWIGVGVGAVITTIAFVVTRSSRRK